METKFVVCIWQCLNRTDIARSAQPMIMTDELATIFSMTVIQRSFSISVILALFPNLQCYMTIRALKKQIS